MKVVVVSAVGWEQSWCSCGCPLDFVVADGGRGGVRPWRWSRSDGWHESGRCILVASWPDGDLRWQFCFRFFFLGSRSMYDLSWIWVSSDWERVVLGENLIFGSGLGWRRIVVILGMVWRREMDMNKFCAAAELQRATSVGMMSRAA